MQKKTTVDLKIRTPQETEIDAILKLFEYEVRAGKMLPRYPDKIRKELDNWLVATDGDHVVGCVSLVFFDDDLCEVRSLAVDRAYRGHGLGSDLVKAAVQMAAGRGMHRVLSLTRAVSLFERLDFHQADVACFPEKVWRDCEPCPFRDCCDEVALVYYLDDSHH
ncbi:MAG: GNAT family N-acetyltransferase [Anaerolineae bacterium]|nr:GNAT family N-acetyltransferase [Anaerolineae bacterium]